MSDTLSLADLSHESGFPARTIRFYIARGLLDGPLKAGRGAEYSAAHLARLEQIKNLQSEGRMLSEIVHLLAASPPSVSPPTPWWQHAIQDDVMVWVRGDVSPWRMKQIRAAIDTLAAQLGNDNPNQRTNTE
jgi:DNA-binding transcriptional MerR regulator